MDTLIPFAILKSAGRYVSVDEVPSGNKCGCLCPSCEGPLNARKGDVLKNHFAHASNTASETEACRTSFIRALLWMSVEILQEMSTMKLPSLTYHYRSLRTDTPIRAVEVTEVDYVLDSANPPRLDTTQESITLTILVSGVPIIIRLIANGFIPSIKPTASNAHLAIDIVPAGKLIDDAKSGYKQSLVDFLKNNTESKSWVSHPRLAKRFEEVRRQNSASYDQRPDSPISPAKRVP